MSNGGAFASCAKYSPANLTQVLSCVAAANGAINGGSGCPYPEVVPIRFDKGARIKNLSQGSKESLDALACLLNTKTSRGLRFTLVGHADQYPSAETGSAANFSTSVKRARAVGLALRKRGVKRRRLEIVGRGDTVAMGVAPSDGTSKSAAVPGTAANPSERRVEFELAIPVLTRYGAPAVERKLTKFVRAGETAVRRLPAGLTPGHAVSIEMTDHFGDMARCSYVTTAFQAFSNVTPQADRHAGQLSARFRISGQQEYGTKSIKKKIWLDIIGDNQAAGKLTARFSTSPPYPDFWAVRLRLGEVGIDGTPEGIGKLFSKLAAKLGSGAQDCLGFNPAGSVLDEVTENVLDTVLKHLPMTGDDRLAETVGFSVWTSSVNLKPEMQVCTVGNAVLQSAQDSNNTALADVGNFAARDCVALARGKYAGGVGAIDTVVFNTAVRAITHTLLSAEGALCDDLSKTGIVAASRFADLSCLGNDQSGYRLFFPFKPPGVSAHLDAPILVAGASLADADSAMVDMGSGAGGFGSAEQCKDRKEIYRCAKLLFAKRKFAANLREWGIVTYVYFPFSYRQTRHEVPVGMSVANFGALVAPGNFEWMGDGALIDSSDASLAIDWPVTGKETFK